jgi:hypothetical protein
MYDDERLSGGFGEWWEEGIDDNLFGLRAEEGGWMGNGCTRSTA